MAAYLYSLDGGRFLPTEQTGSPWSTTSQHGGPVNALLMRTAEQKAAEAGMRVARLTVDILKPVPMAPLVLEADFIRQGRRLAVIDATLARDDDGAPVAIARAVALKEHPNQAPLFNPPAGPVPGPEDLPDHELVSAARRESGPPGFHLTIHMRHGPSLENTITWFTWSQDLVADEPVSPAQRCAALCDLTTVASGRLRLSAPGTWDNTQRFDMLNTDTTVHQFRPPVGEWFGFSDSFIADHHGIGVAEVTLYDIRGCLGRCVQSMASNA